jgi:hypothetical protein
LITYRTFSDFKWIGISPRGLLQRWETVREQARRFVANELGEEDVVAITESAFGNSPYVFTVTVWYKKT